MKKNTRYLTGLLFVLTLLFLPQEPALGQEPPRLTGPEKKTLLTVAREPLTARLESRSPRTPTLGRRFDAAQPIVISYWLDGQLVSRHWQLQRPEPLTQSILSVGTTIMDMPKAGRALSPEELSRVKIKVALLSGLTQIADDHAVKREQAVVILNGFKEAVGTPADLPEGYKVADLMSLACQLAGLRSGTWLLPQSSLFSAKADLAEEE